MNIFKVADEKSAPEWFSFGEQKESKTSPIEEVASINVAEEVTEQVLAEECDRIEACSSDGQLYHYNSNWDDRTISHLREYAIACGMDVSKFRPFDPSVIKESKSDHVVKTANSDRDAQVDELQSVIGDPFHIEEHSDTSHMDAANWETVSKQQILDKPTLDTGSVISIGGGESCFKNSDIDPAINQNSITNPNAIQELAESDVEDNGVRLRNEREAKEAQKEANRQEWEQEKIKEMANGDIVPKGVVFPTESLNANTGLDTPSSRQGVYGTFDPDSIPEKTAGEQLKEQNEQYKASIQRPKEQDNWQKPSKQSSRSISDGFAESLETLLKQ